MTVSFPSLPDLPVDAALEVCTHPSLGGMGYPDNSKLAVIGLLYANACIVRELIDTKPLLSVIDIEERRKVLMSDTAILHLVSVYDLKRKLRTTPEVRQQALKSPMDLRNVFFAYLGAIIVHKGHKDFRRFLTDLVPLLDAFLLADGHSHPQHPYHIPDAPNAAHQAPAPANANANAVNNVQLLNEAAQRGNFTVSYIAEAAGEAHAPLWTIRVRVDDVERAAASAADKRSAKETAARDVLTILGLPNIE